MGVKQEIVRRVTEEAEALLGMSMTFTLFEWIKENLGSLLELQPEKVQIVTQELEKLEVQVKEESVGVAKVKKEQLTKNQKKRMWDKGGLAESDRERGWNWIDVIKHLHQTGGGPETE